MPSVTSKAIAGLKDLERQKRLDRCRRDSWYLATEVLGYGFNPKLGLGLTERIHKPLMAYYDRHRTEPNIGIWMRRKLGHKSTMVCCWIIQEMLIDASVTQGYFHAVEELAAAMIAEVGDHVMNNESLRSLDPIGVDPKTGESYKAFPEKRWRKRAVTTNRVTLTRHRFSRTPSLYSKGAAQEIASVHFTGPVWLDDIIGLSTIENSALGKVKRWVEANVVPVSAKILRSIGTPWSEESIHQEWMESKKWRTLVIPGAITESDEEFISALERDDFKIHFSPDYKFSNPMFWPVEWRKKAQRRLKDDQSEMKGEFSQQIMCDSEPEHEKPWSQGYENTTGRKKTDNSPGIGGPGQIFVLSDPAPFLEGGYRGLGEKQRDDGTKDYWSICCVKLRVRGTILDIILMDGERSTTWSASEGAYAAARMMLKYGATKFFSENPKEHHAYMLSACLTENVRMTRARDGGPLTFNDYNRSDGKNSRMIALADRAKNMEFWICMDTCRPDFLHGDGVHTGFLTQMRKFRKVGRGKNNLRFDDDADVVARSLDTALLEFTPKPHIIESLKPYSPFRDNEADERDEYERAWGKHVRA